MKKSLSKILISTVAVGVFMLSVAFSSWSMPGGEHQRNPAKMVSVLADKLDLTESQEKDINALLKASHAENEADRQRLATLKKILHQQEQSFNEEVARETADEAGEITARMLYVKTSTAAQISGLLNAEQREELAELEKKRELRRGKRRDQDNRGYE
tara:strand:+ start:2796 stop:3266 length:471 start_codon:yes stop_codon:yes gene_type:complete